MKKAILLVLAFLSMFLVSCTRAEYNYTTRQDLSSTILVDYPFVTDLMAGNGSFILYISSYTCSSCAEFKPILEEFIVNYHVVVYQIESLHQIALDNPYFPYQYTPTIVFVDQGEVIYQMDPDSNSKAFASLSGFEDLFFKYYIEIKE